MGKLFRVLALAVLVVMITASGAMAAGSLIFTTGKIIDYKLTSNGTYTLTGTQVQGVVGNVTYAPTLDLTAAKVVKLTLTNATFKSGQTVYLGSASTTNIANGAVGGTNSATVELTVVAGGTITGGTHFTFRNGTGGTPINNTFAGIVFASGLTSSSTVTLAVNAYNEFGQEYTGSAVAATTFVAASATKTLTITGTDTASGTRTVDVGSTPTGRTKFLTNAGTSSQVGLALTEPSVDIGFTLTPAFSLTITGNLQGISSVRMGTNNTSTVTAAEVTAGSKTITGSAWADGNLVFLVNGEVLSARTFTLSWKATSTAETGDGDITPAVSTTMSHVWLINGYQGWVPYVVANSSYKTVCTFNNPTSASVDIIADITNTESAMSLTGLTNIAVGSVVAKGTRRVDFDSVITPYSYASGTETADTPITLTGIGAMDRYGVKFTVTGLLYELSVNCNQVELGATVKRIVPVLTQDSSTGYWKY